MSILHEQSMKFVYHFVADLSLGQTFLFGLWVFCLFLQKLLDAASLLLWRCLVRTSVDEASKFFEVSHGGVDYLCLPTCKVDKGGVTEGSLISALPDEVVKERVWPVLAGSPSLLLRLRCASKQWNRFIETTVEWNALRFTLLDSPEWKASVPSSIETAAFTQRVNFELAKYHTLLSEDLREIEIRVRYSRLGFRFLPYYVSLEGCPPDAEECPGYYGL